MSLENPRVPDVHHIYKANGSKKPTPEMWSKHFMRKYTDVELEMRADGRIYCKKRRSETRVSELGELDE